MRHLHHLNDLIEKVETNSSIFCEAPIVYHISIGVKSVYHFILSHKTFCLILVFDERCSLPRLPDIMTVESTTTSAIVHWTFVSALNTRNETFTILYGRSQEDMAMEAAPMLSQESLQ